MKLNFIGRRPWAFTFIFKYEKWNKDEDPYELRIYILWWEFNFSVKNRNPINYFQNSEPIEDSENYNWENGHSTDKPIVEMKINHLKKAIENLGKDNMQKIYIASNDNGMSDALQSGEYIDLTEELFAYKGIKETLIKMLEVQEEILNDIDN